MPQDSSEGSAPPQDSEGSAPPTPSDEWTAPLDDERTAPYDTGEIRQLDRSELKRVLGVLASEPLRLRSDNLVPRPIWTAWVEPTLVPSLADSPEIVWYSRSSK